MLNCCFCGKPLTEKNIKLYEGELICDDCYKDIKQEPPSCPHCGKPLTEKNVKRLGKELICDDCYKNQKQELLDTVHQSEEVIKGWEKGWEAYEKEKLEKGQELSVLEKIGREFLKITKGVLDALERAAKRTQ